MSSDQRLGWVLKSAYRVESNIGWILKWSGSVEHWKSGVSLKDLVIRILQRGAVVPMHVLKSRITASKTAIANLCIWLKKGEAKCYFLTKSEHNSLWLSSWQCWSLEKEITVLYYIVLPGNLHNVCTDSVVSYCITW